MRWRQKTWSSSDWGRPKVEALCPRAKTDLAGCRSSSCAVRSLRSVFGFSEAKEAYKPKNSARCGGSYRSHKVAWRYHEATFLSEQRMVGLFVYSVKILIAKWAKYVYTAAVYTICFTLLIRYAENGQEQQEQSNRNTNRTTAQDATSEFAHEAPTTHAKSTRTLERYRRAQGKFDGLPE